MPLSRLYSQEASFPAQALQEVAREMGCDPNLLIVVDSSGAQFSIRLKTIGEIVRTLPNDYHPEDQVAAPPHSVPYTLEYQPDGVYIAIMPGHKGLVLKNLVERLEQKQLHNMDQKALAIALSKPGTSLLFAPPQAEFLYNESIVCKVSADGMSATATLWPAQGGRRCNWRDWADALAKANITAGIDILACGRLLREGVYEQALPIAQGATPEKGKDGRLEFHFRLEKTGVPVEGKDGRVDYRSLDLIENVDKGQLLVTAHPPMASAHGYTVTGAVLESMPGKPRTIPVGRGCTLSHDGAQLFASVAGRVELENNRVCVFSRYEVPGDVDLSVGNIDFLGDVIIQGNVLAGFSVKAQGSIEVRGVVESATLQSQSDIMLRGGIRGAGTANVSAGQNVVATFVEGVTIQAQGSVYAESIMQSKVEAQENVIVAGRKALISGSTVRAFKNIVASFAGSPSQTPTLLEVGVSPALRARLEAQKDKKAQHEKNLRRLTMVNDRLQGLRKAGRVLDEDQSAQAKQVEETIALLQSEVEYLTRDNEVIQHSLNTMPPCGVHIRETSYPGVTVAIRQVQYKVGDNLPFTTFKLVEGQVIVMAFCYSGK